ncbi:hypothetical protein PUG46_11710 [Erwiniaceae bacterium L1_55_4]|nr:hypothetical protein [Erwiniaceae bacterium L1_55_4]
MMSFHTTDSICALTGASPFNIRRWQRRGLVTTFPDEPYWTNEQLREIRIVMKDTAQGATTREISRSRARQEPIKSYGWSARRGDILSQLETGTDRQLISLTRSLSRDFSGDDFINNLMRPLADWLLADERRGCHRRLTRFSQLIEQQSLAAGRISLRKGFVPLLLEIADNVDDIYVLLEVIRLTGQGFCVDLLASSSGPLSKAFKSCYDHHLIWGSDRKSRIPSANDELVMHQAGQNPLAEQNIKSDALIHFIETSNSDTHLNTHSFWRGSAGIARLD